MLIQTINIWYNYIIYIIIYYIKFEILIYMFPASKTICIPCNPFTLLTVSHQLLQLSFTHLQFTYNTFNCVTSAFAITIHTPTIHLQHFQLRHISFCNYLPHACNSPTTLSTTPHQLLQLILINIFIIYKIDCMI